MFSHFVVSVGSDSCSDIGNRKRLTKNPKSETFQDHKKILERFQVPRGFSRMPMNFREHTYEFQGVVDFSSSVSSSVQISVQLVGSHLRSVGQRRQHSYQLLLEHHLQTHSVG